MEGWDGVEEMGVYVFIYVKREGIRVYIYLIHTVITADTNTTLNNYLPISNNSRDQKEKK